MSLGNVQGYQHQGNRVLIETERGQVTLRFIGDEVVNVFVPVATRGQDSKAIEELVEVEVELTITEGEVLAISTGQLTVEVASPFALTFKDQAGQVIHQDDPEEGISLEEPLGVKKQIRPDEYFYGLGEKAGFLNKRGDEWEMWNSDIPDPHVPSMKALYKSIPFLIGLSQGVAYGLFFDNTFKTSFDLGKSSPEYYSITAAGGNIDYYFIYGPEMKQVVQRYTGLTGRMELPPMWALGYQQCRWSYTPESRVREIAETMREKEIPCDVIYLDIDYMDEYRVFTWDQERFSEPEKLIADLGEQGFKVVTIVDPGVKIDPEYPVYQEMLEKGYYVRDEQGLPYVGKVWPGDCLFPDFTSAAVRDWWGPLHQKLLDVGIAGIWNDMNEPAVFTDAIEHREPDEVKTMPLTNLHANDGRPATHAEMHNVYGSMMSKATYEGLQKLSEKRPFVVTRAAYAGVQKYSALWTGDNQSFWDHLGMALPMCMNIGLSGVAFVGTDVGGFGHDCTPELLSRWVQVGAFTPFFRNHSAWGTRDQEPWAFDEQTEEINRKYIQLRYRLLPYTYNLFVDASENGLPVMRPLVLEYPDDPEVYSIYDQFMFGEHLLVAPVTTPGTEYRHIYLPEGEWVDYWTHQVYSGQQHILMHAPLDTLPLLVKQGSILPNYEPISYVGEKVLENLILDIYPGEGEYFYYEDDGETLAYQDEAFSLVKFEMTENPAEIKVRIQEVKSYPSSIQTWTMQINDRAVHTVLADGDEVKFRQEEGRIVAVLPRGVEEVRFVKG